MSDGSYDSPGCAAGANFRLEYEAAQTKGKHEGVRAWKNRMQSSIGVSYKWVGGQCKVELSPI